MDIISTLEQIDGLLRSLFEYRNTLNTCIAEADKKVNELYHEIENKNYDVYSGYKMLVKLQEQLRLRRYYKGELIKAQSATSRFKGVETKISKVKSKIQKVDDYASQFPGNKLRLIKNNNAVT